MPSNYDALIDTLYQVQPFDSYADAAKKAKASVRDVKVAIAHLRKHCNNYGWTMPHVSCKHAEFDSSQKGKYFAVILEKDGSLPIDAEKRLHYTRGAYTSLMRVASLLANEAQALLSCSKNERSPTKRYMLESFVRKMKFIEEESKDIAKMCGI